ncbi:hypothetical protein GO986_21785 [Deinococcus sp. HMF7620]|uniref:Uncharacterized protein n=1 Tax=Deinococcus arboris TaxID=2682977 RepID=A0A7C9I224_9DEIO|nr:hypothetical protein [Deinococcus arboris]MVN89370.1 hypothetical protein [Deinococcus arboris]
MKAQPALSVALLLGVLGAGAVGVAYLMRQREAAPTAPQPGTPASTVPAGSSTPVVTPAPTVPITLPVLPAPTAPSTQPVTPMPALTGPATAQVSGWLLAGANEQKLPVLPPHLAEVGVNALTSRLWEN